MILCLCRGVRDGVVCAAIAQGASTVDEITEACEAGADCGGCHDSILDLLEAARGRRVCAPASLVMSPA